MGIIWMQHHKNHVPKRTIAGNPKKPIDINLNMLVQAITTLRTESVAAENELMLLQDDQSKINSLLNAMGDQLWFCDIDGDVLYANTAAYAWFQEEPGKPFINWRAKMAVCTADGIPCDPEDAPLLRALQGEEIRGQLERLKHPLTGEFVYHEVNAIPVKDANNEVIGAVANVRDVTIRYKAERQTQILHDLMVSLSEVNTVPAIAQNTLQQCMRIFASSGGVVLLFSADNSVAKVIAQAGLSEQFAVTYPFSNYEVDAAMAQAVFKGASTGSETLRYLAVQCPDFYQALAQRFDLEAVFSLPLVANHQITGSIVVVFNEPIRLALEDRLFYQVVANYCALALDRAHLLEQAQLAALAQARQGFARDLHDSVTQSLFAARLLTEILLKEKHKLHPDVIVKHLERLYRLTSGALAQMRNLLLEMRPEHWEMVAIEDILMQAAQATMGNSTLDITVKIAEPLPALSAQIRSALYFITQEALNNIIKHAKARHVAITLERRDEQIMFSVIDDGQGFKLDQVKRGMGLGNMRDRTLEIGGHFEIENLPEGGTRISVLIDY